MASFEEDRSRTNTSTLVAGIGSPAAEHPVSKMRTVRTPKTKADLEAMNLLDMRDIINTDTDIGQTLRNTLPKL